MREKIFAILTFLSQSLEQNRDLFYDAQDLWEQLMQKGFSESDIEEAVSHIERTSLELPGTYWSDVIPAYRSYSREELSKLPPRVRGYLWKLKCKGVIDHAMEDEIIQKAMNLESPPGIREIKTVAALTVFGHEHRHFSNFSSHSSGVAIASGVGGLISSEMTYIN